MGNARQYSGRYGRLTVLGRAPSPSTGGKCHPAYWQCICDCGKTLVIRGACLANGQQSCGCKKHEQLGRRSLRHGMYGTPEYNSWSAIKERCCNPRNANFHNYGGRGIKMCQRWREGFRNFYSDMGNRPSLNHSIDRIDVNGDYEPGNCRWATPQQQGRNRRDSIILSARGRTMPLNDWAELLGIKRETILSRLRSGKSVEYALFAPVSQKFKKKN